jgi:hypothetical protein
MEGVVANSSRIHKGTNPKKMELAHSREQVYQLELVVQQQHHLWYNLLLLLN